MNVIPTLPTKGPIMRTTIATLASAVILVGAMSAPVAAASPWSPPHDPTSDPTHPVLRWVPKMGPTSSQGSVREVREVRTVRKVGEQR